MVAWVSAPRRRCALLVLTLLVCLTLLLGDGIFLSAYKAIQRQHRNEVAPSNNLPISVEGLQTLDETDPSYRKQDLEPEPPEPESPEPVKPASTQRQSAAQRRAKAVSSSAPARISSVNQPKPNAISVKESNVSSDNRTYPKVGHFKSSFNFVLNHKDVCGKDAGASVPLLIIVTTGVTKFDARDALRTTWGGYARDLGAKMIFLLGRTGTKDLQEEVQDENAVYKDIIQANFTDCYMNMTLKTVAMMKWVSDHCSKVRFVLKTDDDMFINVDLLLAYVAHMRNATKCLIGKVAKGWKPHRDQRNKWYVSPEQFSGTHYPHFTTGPAYLFTGDAARPLYEASLRHTFLYLEDVLVTGIVAQNVSVKRIHQPAMRNRPQKVTYCSFRQMMTSHKHTPDDIENLWEEVNRSGVECKPSRPASDVYAAALAKNSTITSDKK